MIYGSVCSGIETASVAWQPLGWKAAFYSEIEPFPRAVLQHHYPQVPLHGDFTTIKEDEYGSIDVLVGGTPCQDFSIAGLRGGITGNRGNLTLEFLYLVKRKKPRWVVWENVPGILSLDGGRTFGAFLGGLAQCGYGFAYRILDAQYFGVPQRRRRVFVIGCAGSWQRAAAVLFEQQSLLGDITPRRETREGIARTLAAGAGSGGEQNFAASRGLEVSGTINAAAGRARGAGQSPEMLVPTYTIKGAAIGREPENGPQYGEILDDDTCYTLNCTEQHAVAFSARMTSFGEYEMDNMASTLKARDYRDATDLICCVPINTQKGLRGANSGNATKDGVGIGKDGDPAFTLQASHSHAVAVGSFNAGNGAATWDIGFNPETTPPLHDNAGGGNNIPALLQAMHVRRLIPLECERLQGCPDNYTLIPYGSKNPLRIKYAKDAPRYKALGNAMPVPVMRWLGEQIEMVEGIK